MSDPMRSAARAANTEAHQQEIQRLRERCASEYEAFKRVDASRQQVEADLATLRQERDQWQKERTRLREALEQAVKDRDAARAEHVSLAEMVVHLREELAAERLWNALRKSVPRDHVCHDMNPPFSGPCKACEIEKTAALTPPAATPQEPERCVWTYDKARVTRADAWVSSCGHRASTLDTAAVRCCYCGRPLTVAAPQEEK